MNKVLSKVDRGLSAVAQEKAARPRNRCAGLPWRSHAAAGSVGKSRGGGKPEK